MASPDELMAGLSAADIFGRCTDADASVRRSARRSAPPKAKLLSADVSGATSARDSGVMTRAVSPAPSPSGELADKTLDDDVMGASMTRSLSGSYACAACEGSGAGASGSSGGCACPDMSERAWTTNPHVQLVANARVIAALKRDVAAHVGSLEKPDRELMREVGDIVARLSGYDDFCFFEPLPPVDANVVVLRALCPLRAKTLADGDETLTGGFIDSFEGALGLEIVRTNISGACHRKGDAGGKELAGGAAGCCDPSGVALRVLADVKDLHYLCLHAAGVHVLGIIASSNASIESFGVKPADVDHFEKYDGQGIYKGADIYFAPHPKYISALCINNKSVTTRIGGSLGDRLSTPSRVLGGWAKAGASLLRFEGDAAVYVAGDIYELVREDPTSGATVREWPLRFTTTTTPETEARLKEALRQQSSDGGEGRRGGGRAAGDAAGSALLRLLPLPPPRSEQVHQVRLYGGVNGGLLARVQRARRPREVGGGGGCGRAAPSAAPSSARAPAASLCVCTSCSAARGARGT